MQQVLRLSQPVCLLMFNLLSLTFASFQGPLFSACYQLKQLSQLALSPPATLALWETFPALSHLFPCSALDAGQTHLLVEAAGPGAEAGRIPSYPGITSPLCEAYWALCGWGSACRPEASQTLPQLGSKAGTEIVPYYPKSAGYQASTETHSHYFDEKV